MWLQAVETDKARKRSLWRKPFQHSHERASPSEVVTTLPAWNCIFFFLPHSSVKVIWFCWRLLYAVAFLWVLVISINVLMPFMQVPWINSYDVATHRTIVKVQLTYYIGLWPWIVFLCFPLMSLKDTVQCFHICVWDHTAISTANVRTPYHSHVKLRTLQMSFSIPLQKSLTLQNH